MHDELRHIRTRLRLSMNGVVASSMREKGLNYKLNFGVSLPKIKEIAKEMTPSTKLAEALWAQDVREMKILATLLQPVQEFPQEQAERWANQIPTGEIAEQYAMNLLPQLPYATTLATTWIYSESSMHNLLGFLLLTRLFMNNKTLSPEQQALFLKKAKEILDATPDSLYPIALSALSRFGRRSKAQADSVLKFFSAYQDLPEKKDFYEDFKFEFSN